jgi:hypothetical protein
MRGTIKGPMFMIIGTHNTMTYLEPKKWWMKLLNKYAQCQSKTIEEQYEAGCRYFDLRIRFREEGMYFAHGLIEYKSDKTPMDIFNWLLDKSNEGKIYVRILLETMRFDVDQCNYFNCWYLDTIINTTILENHPNFKLRLGLKNPWTEELDKFDVEFVEVAEYINSLKKLLKTPKWFADNTQDEKIYQLRNFEGIVAADFI